MFSPMMVQTTNGSLVRLTLSRIGNIVRRSPCSVARPRDGNEASRRQVPRPTQAARLGNGGAGARLQRAIAQAPDEKARLERTEAAMEMIYIADPMCSWCYGFRPVISALAARFGGKLPLRLMMGGLRAGNREPWAPPTRTMCAPGLDARGRRHGPAFRYELFAREGFTYDTEPACRAVVACGACSRGSPCPSWRGSSRLSMPRTVT